MYPYIHIFGRQIGSYGLCMAIAMLLVGFLSVRRGKQYRIVLEDIAIVGATAIGFALVSGGLLYCFVTYPLEVIWTQLKAFNLGFFFGGGIVFFGALLGAIPGAILGIRWAKCKTFDLERTVVPWIPLGHGIGRIGCLLAGCCYGMPYDGPLAVSYPNAVTDVPKEMTFFPVQPLETLINVVICVILLSRAKKVQRAFDLLFDYLGLYAISRFCLEYLRGDDVRGIYWIFSVSQWISIGLLALWGVRKLWFYMRSKKAPIH